MPTYNPPQQVLFQPVTSFYKGKAIRQQLAAGEQEMEFKSLQIKAAKQELKNAPEVWAAAKKLATSKQDQIDLALETAERDGKWTELQRSAQVLIPWVQEIGKLAGKDGANSAEAMARANETSAQMIEQLSGVVSEEQLEALQGFAGADNVWQPEEFLMLGKYLESFMKKDTAKPTSKMIEGASMGLAPGTPEWDAWIRGTGEGNKPLAIEVKLQLAKDVMNKSGQYEGISDEEQAAYMSALGMQSGPKGSVTLSWDQAGDIADDIVNRTDIGENFFGWDDEAFNDQLTFSLMRLAKDGRYGGNELYERAIVDALGGDYEEMLEATKETGEDGKPIATMAELIDALASLQ